MTFKARATATTTTHNKEYFWRALVLGQGIQVWCYVTADPATTVDGSGYITDTFLIQDMNVGDLVLVWVADAISDAQNIQADLAAGMADFSLHMVMENTGSVVDLSTDLLGATLTYGD